MTEYKLSKNKVLVIEDNWAAIKQDGRVHTRHIFMSDWYEYTDVEVINENKVLIKAGNEVIGLEISGIAITVR